VHLLRSLSLREAQAVGAESRWRQEGKWGCRERSVWEHRVRKVEAGSERRS